MPRSPLKADSPRARILSLEKRLFAENKAVINDATKITDPHFKEYWRCYKRAISGYRNVSDMDAVLKAVRDARVVIVGDYHTLDQSQRSFVRLLRSWFEETGEKKVSVAIETVQARHQKHLENYMLGRIDAGEFIRRVGFKKHWFFDLWPNYEVVFDFLIYHHIPIVAVEADTRMNLTLPERDAFMASIIAEHAVAHPGEKIFVLVGDLHLAPRHLPRDIARAAKKRGITLPTLILYQNSPAIHWLLAAKGVADHVDVVRISADEFCRQHTPPIIVQQSYLNWLYHEEDSFDWIDAKGSFLSLVTRIAGIVGLKAPRDVENVEVYTCGDLSFLKTLRCKKIFTRDELKFVQNQVLRSQSYFMPRARMAYIANVSIHHAAEEATHYLKFLLSGEEFPRPRQDAFYANVLHEALGFFGSKLVNPKRKCERSADFERDILFLRKSQRQAAPVPDAELRVKTAELFLQHEHDLRRRQLFHSQRVLNMSADIFLAVTHAVGYELGDHLYYAFMGGNIPHQIVRDLFTEHFEEEGEPGRMYLALTGMLRGVKRPPKI